MVFSFGVLLGDGFVGEDGGRVGLGGARLAAGFPSMSAEECKSSTLFASEDELLLTPRNDTSTEAVAAGIDREAVASQVYCGKERSE